MQSYCLCIAFLIAASMSLKGMIRMKALTAKEVQKRLESGEKLSLLDVREVDEVKEGHIPGIINVPLKLLEFKMHDLDKSVPYIVLCRSGGRSSKAVQFLEAYGFDVTNMQGGMLEWEGKQVTK